MDDDWRFDWEEVDGYLRPRRTPLTALERERKWVRDNWERLKRHERRIDEVWRCCTCKQEIKGIYFEVGVKGRTVRECDECFFLKPPPPDTRNTEHLSDRQYHGGFGSHTLGRFRNADDT